jgi:ankyrin repeat protein
MRRLPCILILSPSFIIIGCKDQRPPENPSVHIARIDSRGATDPADTSEDIALTEAKAALDRGGSPHDVIESLYGLTRVHVAARNGHCKVLGYLIQKGGDVNIKHQGGRGIGGETPLHWASTGEAVDLLIAHGAQLDAPGPAGQSPLASAAGRNRPSAVKAMIRWGNDVNAHDTLFGNSIVMWACLGLTVDYGDPDLNRYEDRLAIIEYLVSKGADVNARDNDGETALHIAARYHPRIVELLLRLGADATVRDKQGRLPIDLSRELGQDDISAILEKAVKR